MVWFLIGGGPAAEPGGALVLDHAVVQALVADHHPVRDANQFHVRKHEAGAHVAIIQQDLQAGRGQVGI
jgi:hypothetical protein